MKHKLLLVDDQPANLRALERLLRSHYDVLTAESGSEALELLMHDDVALIISDQRMPAMSGIEFLNRAAQLRPQTVRIILTGYTDIGDVVEAINSGVLYKYLTKPWVNSDLLQTVQRAIEHYQNRKGQYLLAQENERLEIRLKTTVQGFVNAVRETISQKNPLIAEHCRRTAGYAARIGRQFGLGPNAMEQLSFACLLHEAPNMRLPFEMDINKASLTPEQHRATFASYESGIAVISSVPDLEEVATILRYQHEHHDGHGFFSGLSGDAIPLGSRILSVASAFDQITSGRHSALIAPGQTPADWLRSRSGKQFAPSVVDSFLHTEAPAPIPPQHLPNSPDVMRPSSMLG